MGLASNIAYLKTGEGFMYHCVIRDIVAGDVLGDHMADRMTKELVLNAIIAMLARHEPAKGCIFHSDRCSQYTLKSRDGFTAAVWPAPELLAIRNAKRQCVVGELLCDHEKRAGTLYALRNERSRPGGSV